jgi:ABC-type Zn2+ transport system substrate-binding protein/surface adhesin
MASHLKPATTKPTRGISKNVASDPNFLPHLADLIEDGEITVGTLDPIGGVATAVDGSNCLAMLVRRDGESLMQLLQRLDLAVALAFTEDIFTDEVNPPVRTSRSRK